MPLILPATDVLPDELGVTEGEAETYARLAGALIYADPAKRAASNVLLANRRGQSGLWKYGISGDIPIVLLRISDPSQDPAREATYPGAFLLADKGAAGGPGYFNRKGLRILPNALIDQIISLIAPGRKAEMLDKPAGIFIRHLDQLSSEDLVLLQSVPRASS